ncbi:MAG: hypothetical protein WKF70_07005, partial [Chitinophagaceae bacterium]
MAQAELLSADYFSNALLMNKGNLVFETQALPPEAQLTSFRDGAILDANNDGKPDILLAGNYYDNNIEMGRYDADYGTVLINKGGGRFAAASFENLQVRGQVRRIMPLEIGGWPALI